MVRGGGNSGLGEKAAPNNRSNRRTVGGFVATRRCPMAWKLPPLIRRAMDCQSRLESRVEESRFKPQPEANPSPRA